MFGNSNNSGVYLFFLLGVIVSSWFQGFYYGLITTLFSAFLINYFLQSPVGSLRVATTEDVTLLIIFLILSTVICYLAENMHTAIKKSRMQLMEIEEMKTDLKSSSEKIQILMDSINDAFLSIDSAWKVVYLNHEAEVLLKTPKSNIIGEDFWSLFPNSKETDFSKMINNALTNNESISFDNYFPDNNKWLEIHAFPTLQNNGLALYLRDITSFKEREEVMRKNESYYKKFVNSNVIGIVIADLNWKIIDVNTAFLNMLGYSREELDKGFLNWNKITPKKYKEIDNKQAKILKNKGVTDTYEKVYLKKDGSRVQALVARIMIDYDKGIHLSYVLDISERKQNERKLKESRDQLEVIFQNVADAISVQDEKGKTIFLNDKAAELLGYSSAEEIWKLEPKGLAENLASRFELFDENGKTAGNKDLPATKVLKGEKKEVDKTFRLYDKLGKKYRWLKIKSTGIFDDQKKIKLAINIASDITETRERERLKDEFMSIASHELKTPITTIKAFTQILIHRSKKEDDEKSLSYLKKMDIQVDNLTNLSKSFIRCLKTSSWKIIS